MAPPSRFRPARPQEDLRQTVLIHLFEPSLEVLSAVIRQSPGSDSAAVAMSLVLLLQQSHRTEEFLRRELSTRLQTAQSTRCAPRSAPAASKAHG